MRIERNTKRRKMTRKIIGTILLVAAVVLSIILFTMGRLIFPHVTGPITLAVIGVILLIPRGKS
jgi:O-antigen/teichoic acid export membrane protein